MARPLRTSKFMVSSALSAANKNTFSIKVRGGRNATQDAVPSLKSECKKDIITKVSAETRNTLGTSCFTSLLAFQCELAVSSLLSNRQMHFKQRKNETQYEERVHSKVLRQRDTQTNSTNKDFTCSGVAKRELQRPMSMRTSVQFGRFPK